MLNWLLENWDKIFEWIGIAVTVSTAAVKVTPTTKDDSIVNKVVKVLDYASVVNTAENKAKLEKLTKKN